MAERLTPPPLGLYVHLPWCVQKCPYCDFNAHALRGDLPEFEYVDALLRDTEQLTREWTPGPVQSLFIGGGTPSLFSPEAIARLLTGLQQNLTLTPGMEITLEANPGTVDASRFEGFLGAGVNRLSIGAQSFSSRCLQALGRIHDGAGSIDAIQAARRAGFERINVDLMHGLPGQTVEEAVYDVDTALSLAVGHLSYYQLTLEPGTPFHYRPPVLPDDDELSAIEAACADRIAAAGLRRHEISAWARPGEECRHNVNYWRFGDYLAVGAGAHGKLTFTDGRILRYRLVHLPRQYLALAGTPASIAEQHPVPQDELPLEYLMNALRLTDGAPVQEALERTGLDWEAFADGVAEARWRGWLRRDPERLAPTEDGQRYLNDLLGLFMSDGGGEQWTS